MLIRHFQRTLLMSLAGALVLGWAPHGTHAEDRPWKEIESHLGTLWKEKRFSDIIAMSPEALRVAEQTFGPNDPQIVSLINTLGHAYRASVLDAMSRYAHMEPLYRRALAIGEQAEGLSHPDVALTLNNLAELYLLQGRNVEAEPLYRRAVAIWQQTSGPPNPQLIIALNNLAMLYKAQGRKEEAERTRRQVLALKNASQTKPDASSPPEPPQSGSAEEPASAHTSPDPTQAPPPTPLSGERAQLEATYRWKLSALEGTVGPEHPAIATVLTSLAELYIEEKRYDDAEPLYARVAKIVERDSSDDAERTLATALNSLLELYTTQERWQEAKPLYERLLVVMEHLRGPGHSDLIPVLEGYAKSLEVTGHDAKEIKAIRKRIERIQKTFISH